MKGRRIVECESSASQGRALGGGGLSLEELMNPLAFDWVSNTHHL
jgi:hypothetical protein